VRRLVLPHCDHADPQRFGIHYAAPHIHRTTADAAPERLRPTTLAAAGIAEADLQGWIIADPGIIDDDLLIITAEYGGFGWLRDRADATTDLQALNTPATVRR